MASCRLLRRCRLRPTAFTLNALAVGLGAVYPNFREDNPSKIVSGFGGTLLELMTFLDGTARGLLRHARGLGPRAKQHVL